MGFFDETPSRRRSSEEEREYLYSKQKGKCNYCGCKLAIHHFHVDHKNPVGRGGSERLSNKQFLCGPCNSRKGDLTDGEFRRRYRLPGSRVAKSPPRKEIAQEYFKGIAKEVAAKNAAKRRREGDYTLL